jgi:Mce-associated membrane protein
MNTADSLVECDPAQADDPSLISQAEAEAVAAEELAAAARARAEKLRAMTNEADSSPEGETTARRRLRRPKLSTMLAVFAVLVSAALLTAGGYMFNYHRQLEHEQQRRAEFAASASQAVVTLMSIDGTKAEDNIRQIIANSTGQFRDDFQADAKDFAQVARDSKASTQAAVRSAAVESMTADSAVVLVTAATTVSNSAGANQQPRNWRLSVTMIKDGAQLKMSKVEFVP